MIAFVLPVEMAIAQDTTRYSGPIIDMHLHAYNPSDYDGGQTHRSGINSPTTAQDHLEQTRQLMVKYNIKKAMIDGASTQTIKTYLAGDESFIVGYNDRNGLLDIGEFEDLIQKGVINIFGEITAVYKGKTLNDPVYEPYLKLCEQYGIPVAYHTGGGPKMTPYRGRPEFRLSLGDPLLIEDVLVMYPNLKIYLMHGGEVFYEHAIRMMRIYPQLHIGLGVLLWSSPYTQDYAVRILKLAKKADLMDRVLFGTDQMDWPEAIGKSVDFLNALDFLTEQEKANIFYNNAARFLELSEEEVARHHGKNDN